MRVLLLALLAFPLGLSAQGLPVLNGNSANGRPGQVQTVSTTGSLVWSNLPSAGTVGAVTNNDTRMLALTGAVVRAVMSSGRATNLNIWGDSGKTPPDALVLHPATPGAAVQINYQAYGTNYAYFGADPAAGAFIANFDLSHLFLFDTANGNISWTGVATGDGGGLTRIQEQALVYPAANPAAGLVLTSTSSNTAAWLAASGQSLGIVTNGGTGIDNTLSNLTVISSVGTRNALLIKTPPGGNTIPIFAITNVGVASTHFLHVDNNGVLYANGAGVTNIGGVKVYKATLTQSGGSAPTATVSAGNNLGTIVWARSAQGTYTGTLSGAFTANKTYLYIGNTYDGADNGPFIAFYRTDANVVTITTRLIFEGAIGAQDDVLTATSIRIEVDP